MRECDKRRHDYLEMVGLCVTCGREKAAKDRKQCRGCLLKASERYRQRTDEQRKRYNAKVSERYYRLKAEGICVACGRTKSRPGKIYCQECAGRWK